MDNSLTQVDETTRQDLIQSVEDARALDQVFNTFDPALFLAVIVTGSIVIGLAWFVIGKLTAALKASGPSPTKIATQNNQSPRPEQKDGSGEQKVAQASAEKSANKPKPQNIESAKPPKPKRSLDIGRRTRN